MAKLVVVTGGEGFIGRDVRSVLLSGGDDVISLDRQNGRQSFGGLSLECDITDGQRVEEIFASMSRQVYGIAHLASTLRTASERDPKQATEVNILGSLNVLEAARKFGVARVVFASSISIYGSKGTQDDVSETDYTAPEDMYGAAKKYIEVLGNTYSHKFGIQFVSMRILAGVPSA
jgi:nucleoside-diphosphate-sugar epimerase